MFRLVSSLTIGVCVITATTGRGETVFTTRGDGDVSSSHAGWGIHGGGVEQGFQFSPMKTVWLDTIEVAASYREGSGINIIDFELRKDDSDYPGLILENFSIAFLPTNIEITMEPSVSHPLLFASERYWLTARSGDGDFVWWYSVGTPANRPPLRCHRWSWADRWSVYPLIYENPYATITGVPVPEPCSVALLSIGSLALLAYVWRGAKGSAEGVDPEV